MCNFQFICRFFIIGFQSSSLSSLSSSHNISLFFLHFFFITNESHHTSIDVEIKWVVENVMDSRRRHDREDNLQTSNFAWVKFPRCVDSETAGSRSSNSRNPKQQNTTMRSRKLERSWNMLEKCRAWLLACRLTRTRSAGMKMKIEAEKS